MPPKAIIGRCMASRRLRFLRLLKPRASGVASGL